MKNKTKTFLKMLLIELEDVEEDFKILLQTCDSRHEKEEITHYVHYENRATYENQIINIKRCVEFIEKINPDNFSSLDALTTHLSNIFQDQVDKRWITNSLFQIIKEKEKKIKNYIEQ